tara:strand:+ start:13273 stop:14523 length:1251 start_codon:yes stop_codon:yes gene_type:complete
MKIVMICEFFNEGLEFQENLLAEYYVRNGHEVVIIASTFESVFDYYTDRHNASAPARTFTHNGFKVMKLRYRYNLLNRLRAYTPIYGILEREKPDLIFVHDIIPNFPEMVRYVKRHPACRMIMDYHADYSNSGANWLSLKVLHGVLRRRILDHARPHLQKIFPVVPAGVTFLEEVYGVPRDEMELLPLGTDLEFGAEIESSGARDEVRAELGIPAEAFVVFTGGKLEPRKLTECLFEGLGQLGRAEAHVIVVGTAADPEYRAQLTAAAEGINAHFVGWQDKRGAYRHIAAADIAVFPASQSVLWQQSLGMGLPIIVSERSELINWHRQEVDYLNRHDNVIVLDHERPLAGQIAGHLGRMMDDAVELSRRSDGARRTAAEILDWNKLIQRTLRFNLTDAADCSGTSDSHSGTTGLCR